LNGSKYITYGYLLIYRLIIALFGVNIDEYGGIS